MEIYQLRSFVTVAELGHLTRAAEKLHISQPALSAQIKALEDELDVTLFERTSGGMSPTAAGKRLVVLAEAVLAATQAIRNEASTLKGEVAGLARLGTLSDPASIMLGQFTSMIVERYPLIELELQQEITGSAFQHVRDGSLDASFYYGDISHRSVAGVHLRDLTYRVVAPHEWQGRIQNADWNEIAQQPWIIPPPISTHNRLAHALFRDHGVELTKVVGADQEAVVSSLVMSGLGMALMREELALEKAAASEVCIWKDVRVTTSLWFIYLREREHDPLIRALVDVLKDTWDLRRNPAAAARRSTSRRPAA